MWLFVLFALIPLALSDSCCNQPKCSQSCPWNNACENGEDVACKNEISGPFKCRDYSKCHNFEECTDADAALRTGHMCNGFPFYNGGYPFEQLNYDNEVESYGCTEESLNGRYCQEWFTEEDSADEFELGVARCVQESANGNYCSKWKVEQIEYQKCWLITYTDDTGKHNTFRECCGETTTHECCDYICSTSFYNGHELDQEQADCECRVESSNGEYCLEWYCEEYNDFNPFLTWKQGLEKEIYTCSHDDPDDKYCTKWYGDIDGYEEFEVSKCVCHTQSDNGEYCEGWNCDESGVDYYWPNLLWTFFSAAMSAPFTLLSFYYIPKLFAKKKYRADALRYMVMFCSFNIVWVGGFIMIGVWKAGFMVFVFSFPIHLVPLILFYVLFRKSSPPATRVVQTKGSPNIDQQSTSEFRSKDVSVELSSYRRTKSNSKYTSFAPDCEEGQERSIIAPLDEGKSDDDDDDEEEENAPDEHICGVSNGEGYADAMLKLKSMLEQGVITDEEYVYKVAALTSSTISRNVS